MITEGHPDSDDYNQFFARNGEKSKTFKIHRLVGEYYLPNPLNLPCINHKIEGPEGKKLNKVIFNEDMSINYDLTTIEWCDTKYNTNYGTRNERIAEAMRGVFNTKKSKPVLQFTLEGETYKGYLWKYKGEA